MGWIARSLERANWKGFLFWFVILFVYSTWAFNMDSPWTRALEAAGGVLPETKPGIPAIEPVRSLEALGENTGDYLLWQALDIPYALFNLMAMSMALALGLKAMRLEASPLRLLLLLPPVYVVCELIENALLAAFAGGFLAPVEPIVLVQQLATTLKFASGMPGLALGALFVLIAFVVSIIRLAKSR